MLPPATDDGRTGSTGPARSTTRTGSTGLFFGGAGSEHRAVHWSWVPSGCLAYRCRTRRPSPCRAWRCRPQGFPPRGENLAVPGVISHRGYPVSPWARETRAPHPLTVCRGPGRVGQLVERQELMVALVGCGRRRSPSVTRLTAARASASGDLVGVHPGVDQTSGTPLNATAHTPTTYLSARSTSNVPTWTTRSSGFGLMPDPHADVEVGLGERGDDARRRVRMVPGTDAASLHFFEREQPVAGTHPVRRDRRCHRGCPLAPQGRCDGGHGNGGVGRSSTDAAGLRSGPAAQTVPGPAQLLVTLVRVIVTTVGAGGDCRSRPGAHRCCRPTPAHGPDGRGMARLLARCRST